MPADRFSMQQAQDLVDPVFPAFLPGEVLIDEIFQPDAADEVVQARGLSGAEEVPGHSGQVCAHRRGGPVRVPQPEGGHDLLVVPPVFIPPVRRGAARPNCSAARPALAEAGAAVLVAEQRAKAVLAIPTTPTCSAAARS
jgi:hypothetical protein